EGFCDFAVGASSRDEAEYFELARAELVESLRRHGLCLFGVRDVSLDEALGDARSEEGFTCGDEADRGEQLAWLSAFEQEAARSCAECAEDVFVELERREDEHTRFPQRGVGGDLSCCFEAVEFGHADVHQDEVWAKLVRE